MLKSLMEILRYGHTVPQSEMMKTGGATLHSRDIHRSKNHVKYRWYNQSSPVLCNLELPFTIWTVDCYLGVVFE
jgi:hypothetical protein